MSRAVPSYVELVSRVAAAITRGAVVMSTMCSVGRYATATDPPGSLRFACLTLTGSVVEALEVEEHAVSFWEKTTEARQDWSAFGAAKAFVDQVGVKAAERALRKLEDGATTRTTKGRAS